MKKLQFALFNAVMFLTCMAHAANVNVVGLFNGKAIVSINGGKPQTLSIGQTKDGIKLLAANSTMATFLIEGKRQTLGMGQALSVNSENTATEKQQGQVITLYADSRGHFMGNMHVNGVSLKYMVDTGASIVAMNSADAKYANVDYKNGTLGRVSTANGLTAAYFIKLSSIKIGGITLYDVDATVTEGGFPENVLLGMSALNRMEMKRDNAVMTLTKKY